MKAYLKAKKYLEVYIVADNTLVSIETIFFSFGQLQVSFPKQVPLVSLGPHYHYSATLGVTPDFG